MAILVGQDVSKYQGDINWETYKNNTNFCIIKASEGTGYTDPKFSRNQSEARRCGVPLGYYHFARPDLGNSAEAEVNWFLKVVGEIRENELLCLDFEPNWAGDAVGWCKTFLDTLAGKLNGYRALIYLNQSQTKGFNWKPVVDAGNGLWIAAYTYDPYKNDFAKGVWPFAAMQQWSNQQQVPGIAGGVDANVFFGDLATYNKYGYHKPVVVVTPPVVVPPVVTPPPTPPTQPPAPCSKCVQAKAIIYAKNFWWVKYTKLKELFKT